MKLYLDTSAVLSYYDKASVFHENSVKLFNCGELELFSGFITLLEMESVIGRNINKFKMDWNKESTILFKSLAEKEKVGVLVDYCVKRLDLHIITSKRTGKHKTNGEELEANNTFILALRLNREMNLRTLDAIQVASAVETRIYKDINLEYFVTNDKMILDNNQKLYQKSRILAISTDELVNLLNL